MFIGHQKIKKYFEQAIGKNQLAQCYLFVGPESVGKFTLAQWIAKNLLNSKESKLEISNHPDFLLIKPEIKQNKSAFKKKQSSPKNTNPIISIDQVRELKRKFFLSSFGGGRKVAVIDKIDRLTMVGQNTCLKLLEELDAQKNIIILTTSSFSSVLPTIISRCQVINFGLVSR
ncbi:MAG TPA: AAA family ATPase, partial [Candidatus Portnoybacteria bacterium]|nr:AAA family ATPase [Candidatus Portnoybacteria bacterium]